MWVSLLWVKYVIQLFTEKSGMQSRAAKLSIKRCIWLKLEAKDAQYYSFSRAKSALIMLLKDMIILYRLDKHTNIT